MIVFNPTAGKGKASELIPRVESLLGERGIEYELRVTQAPWHGVELAREAAGEGFDVVVAAGGDGTVNEVVNGLMLSSGSGRPTPALGVLSIGRGNDFSFGAGLPGELAGCIETLAGGLERPMDTGRVSGGDYPQGRFFANGIGIGFDTIVGLEAAKLRHVHGFMAYVFGAVKTFIIYPNPTELRVAHDGGVIEKSSHQMSIMNGKRMGGVFFMAPASVNDDGLLDYCMAGDLTRRDMVGLILRYTKGTQAEHPKIETGRSSRYAITSLNGGLVVHADGETICTNGSSLLIECFPSSLSLVCASEGAA
jgi:diacylglycerol kinase (ATP)